MLLNMPKNIYKINCGICSTEIEFNNEFMYGTNSLYLCFLCHSSNFVWYLLQFLCVKNIKVFLQACKTYFAMPESDLFKPPDLFEGSGMQKVCVQCFIFMLIVSIVWYCYISNLLSADMYHVFQSVHIISW